MEQGFMNLRGHIYAKYRTETEMARHIGWSRQRLNRIVNGQREPSLMEVSVMAKALEMPFQQMASFFIPGESPNG